MKVEKYHKVSNLTLKWCKMSFYFILFQCEIWNMTSMDVNNKWVCTFHTGIFRSSKSNAMPFWLNIMDIQEWTKNSLYKIVQTHIHIFEMWRNWMFLDVNKFHTGRVSNTMAFYTVLMWGKDSIYWKITKLNLTLEPLIKRHMQYKNINEQFCQYNQCYKIWGFTWWSIAIVSVCGNTMCLSQLFQSWGTGSEKNLIAQLDCR